MDQEKVGRFIAECRKGKGLTQAQVAEQFGISNRAVSKWENGKSLPDASIMLDLCELLGITANELLSGERIVGMENYQKKSEDNLLELQTQLKAYKKRIVINNVFLLLVAIASAFEAPLALIFIVPVTVFRDYYLIKNMKSVKQIIEDCKNSACQ